ncbi:MAG: Crp/Fnr family transcriptional regulator [Bacteroidota bacterium]
MVDENILKQYGAVGKQLNKGETLFQEGDPPIFYYQVVDGEIKLNNYNSNGKEMIQGIYSRGEGFGAPALLGDFVVCSNAEATKPTQLICLEKSYFVRMLKDHPHISFQFLQKISKRLQFKTMIAKEINCHEAEQRILNLFKYLKKEAGEESEFQIRLTRQTIANIIGLRVETVIRTIKNLKEKGLIQVKNRKLYL